MRGVWLRENYEFPPPTVFKTKCGEGKMETCPQQDAFSQRDWIHEGYRGGLAFLGQAAWLLHSESQIAMTWGKQSCRLDAWSVCRDLLKER